MLMPPPLLPEPGPRPSRTKIAITLWTAIAGMMLVIVLAGLAVPPIGRMMMRHEVIAMAAAATVAIGIALVLVRGAAHYRPVWAKCTVAITLVFWATSGVGLVYIIKRAQQRSDLRAMFQIRFTPDRVPYLPPGVQGGGITRESMIFMRYAVGRDLASHAAYARLGLVRLDPLSERTDKTLFEDCARFARAKPAIDAIDDTALDAITAFRTRLDDLIDDAGDSAAVIAKFDATYGAAPSHRARRQQLVHDSLDQAGALCALLAQRHWRLNARGWWFTDAKDRVEYFRLRAAIERDRRDMMAFTPPSRYRTASPSPKLAM